MERMTKMDGAQPRASTIDATREFLADLTELSMKHGIAIGGTPVLFVMEGDDYRFAYRLDDQSNLSLG
jgi:hypothetical protein